MTEEEIKRWYAQRVPLSDTLSAYAMLVGQNNRALTSKTYILSVAPGGTQFIPPNPNRVALSFTADTVFNVGINSAEVSITDNPGVVNVYTELLFYSTQSVIDITLGQFYNRPIYWNVRQQGPIIQNRINLYIVGTVFVNAIEVAFMPKCCDYIGGRDGPR